MVPPLSPPARCPHSNGLNAAHIYSSRWWRGHSPCLSSPATLGWSGLNRLAGDLDEQVRTLAASYDRTYDRISMTGTMTGPMTGGLWQAIYDRTYDKTYDRWPCRAPAVAAGASGRGRVLVARPFCTPSALCAARCRAHTHAASLAAALITAALAVMAAAIVAAHGACQRQRRRLAPRRSLRPCARQHHAPADAHVHGRPVEVHMYIRYHIMLGYEC
jgi:hypothetical protein